MSEEKVLEILRMIANPTRLEILKKIQKHHAEDGVTCSCVLTGMEISQSTFSHHIAELAESGLVITRPQGRFNMLSIDQGLWQEFELHLGKTVFGESIAP